MNSKIRIFSLLAFAAMAAIGGCGSSKQKVPLAITTSTLPNGVVGTAYSQTLAFSGGTALISWSVTTGTLPAGLTLAASTGVISGTPTTAAASNFTVTATDSSTPTAQTKSQALTITIGAAQLAITTSSLANGVAGTAYSATLHSSGGTAPISWSVTTGTLPAGLTLAASTGVISGTPTAGGASNFTVTATDSGTPTPQVKTQALTITINATLAITTTTIPVNAVVGSAYNATLQSSGGVAPITWSSVGLPAGLTLNASTGVISGSPAASTVGPNVFNVTATDSGTPTPQTATKTFSFPINPALAVATTTLPTAAVSGYYSQTLQKSGGSGAVTWSVTSGSLPAGFTLAASTGVITGLPTATGTTNFTVTATDSETPTPQTASQSLSIVVGGLNANCGTGSESKLHGQYAFLMQGFLSTGTPFFYEGSFVADGAGGGSGGQMDINQGTGAIQPAAVFFSYSVGSDNRGCLNITSGALSQVLRFSLGSITSGVAAKARLVEFDTTGITGTGVMELQDPTAFSNAQFSGNYAFGVSGAPTSASGGSRYAGAGRFHAASGGIFSGEVDLNTGGTMNHQLGVGGTYNVASTGRGTLTLLVTGSNPVNAVFYVISATRALVMSSDPASGAGSNPMFVGSILQQANFPYAINSLNSTAVFSQSIVGSSGGSGGNSDVAVGLLTPDGAGNYTEVFDNNAGGITSTQIINSATYTVASNGRAVLNPVIGGTLTAYLVDNNKGFLEDSGGGTAVVSGFFEPQVAGPFTATSLSGNYIFARTPIDVTNSQMGAGIMNVDGVGTYSQVEDFTVSTSFRSALPFSLPYSLASATNGRFVVSGANNVYALYVVSPTKAVGLPIASSDQWPTVLVFEQ